MPGMRNLPLPTFVLIVFLGVFQGENFPQDERVVAGAVDAAIGIPPKQTTIVDHYGDPDGFMKYIIRKPPIYA